MDKIEVSILHEANQSPDAMMMFLAKLTQRGHKVSTMVELRALYSSCNLLRNFEQQTTLQKIANLPHGTIKRFSPITVAIVGASRRFLTQVRTHQVGFTYVSASLQYSDYSKASDFVVPYALTKRDHELNIERPGLGSITTDAYIESCQRSMGTYGYLAQYTDNDTAGYAAPQGLRNVLIMQGNHESWEYFIRRRACRRNTDETRYVATLIWDLLLTESSAGEQLFATAGPDCWEGACREGSMCCGNSFRSDQVSPKDVLREDWPLIYKG